MAQFVDARGFSLVPQMRESDAFARGIREMVGYQRQQNKDNEDAESLRQAGMLVEILDNDDAGPIIDHLYKTETNPDVHAELGQLRDIYLQDPTLAKSIVEGQLRGDRIGNELLKQRESERARFQQSASSRGFAPTPIRVQVGVDDKGIPIYETQMAGVSYDPRSGEYAVQNIPLGGDIIGFERDKAEARGRGGEAGKISAQVSATPNLAKSAAEIARAKKIAEEQAKIDVEKNQATADAISTLENLERTANDLRELSQMATYTYAGRAFDLLAKEAGFGGTEGATARAKYNTIINNYILPNAKKILGGAFTAGELGLLTATLGDANATPEEKQAALDAAVKQARDRVNNLRSPAQSKLPSASETISDEDLLNLYGN